MLDGATVSEGKATDAAAYLILNDDDLAALAAGKASAQSLFMHGALRVDGDVRLAHRVGILNKLA